MWSYRNGNTGQNGDEVNDGGEGRDVGRPFYEIVTGF